MRFPKIDDVAAQLRSINKQQSAPDGAEGGIDVRLQVYPDGDWAVRWGLSDYDQDHRGYWGSSSVPGDNRRFDSKDLARDLIDQAKEHFAQGDDDEGLEESVDENDEEDDDEDDDEEYEEDEESEEEDDDEDVFSEDEMREGFIIADNTRGGYDLSHRYRHYGNYKTVESALKMIAQVTERDKFYPNIYVINDHGNIDLIDEEGNVLESRV